MKILSAANVARIYSTFLQDRNDSNRSVFGRILRVGLLDDHAAVRYVHNADGVGEAGALLPAGNDDHRHAGLQEATFLAKLHTVLDARVNVLQPVLKRGL